MLSLTSVLDHGGQSAPRRACFACTGSWVGTRGIWTGVVTLVFTGIQSPDHPTSSKLLCRFCCPGPSVYDDVL